MRRFIFSFLTVGILGSACSVADKGKPKVSNAEQRAAAKNSETNQDSAKQCDAKSALIAAVTAKSQPESETLASHLRLQRLAQPMMSGRTCSSGPV